VDLTRKGRVALVIMAKAPAAGRVKTRLSPPLSAGEAAELSRCFLLDTIERVREVRDVAPVIAHDPPEAAPLFRALAPEFGLRAQQGPDLGARMAECVAAVLGAGATGVVLVGSDAPHVSAEHIRLAVRLLGEGAHDVVLGPSEDGGYYLIGLRRLHRELFDSMAWSTAGVFEETIARCRSLQLRVALLPPGYDVDTPEALARLEADLAASGGAAAPRTWQFLAARLR
jgi:rSAM/selenodomain-associated transferase 1